MAIDKRKLTKAVKDKYSLENETFKRVQKDNPKDKIEVEIGDSKSPDFKPQVKIQRWDNEVNLSFRLKDDGVGIEVVETKEDKVIWKKGKREAHFYELTEGEGGYEFEVVLLEKPDTNVVEFTVEDKDIEYFYQAALTPEEIADGASRPENVVGSYAVYAKTPKTNYVGQKEYKTGKVGHIYRPRIEDANGTKVWGDLHIENGILSVTIPQEFLDKAVYPVRHAAGLTFGYTSIGASNGTSFANDAVGSLFTSPSDIGAIDSVTIRASDSFGSAGSKPVIVLHSSLNIVTNGVAPAITTIGATNWYTSNYSSKPTLSTSTEYLLMAVFEFDDTIFYYDSGAADQGHTDTSNSYATPANLGTATHSTRQYSIYATYTAAGSASSSPSPSVSSSPSPSVSSSPSPSVSSSPSPSPSPSVSASPSPSVSSSPSPSVSSSPSPSASSSPSPSPSSSPSPSPSASSSPSPSPSPSVSSSPSPSSSSSPSPSPSASSSPSPSPSEAISGWQTKPLYYWDGSEWIEVDVSG